VAFTHGKKARLWIDQYELTSYFNEFQMMAKAGIAETTVFGLGAKTFIGGILEGQITGKGFFGAALTDVEDSELSAALGRNTNMAVMFSPNGATAAGTRVIVSSAAETDLQISAPVAGVVSTNFSAQADSGLSTGCILYDPTTAAITTATTVNAPTGGINDAGGGDAPTTTIAAGSGGATVASIVTGGTISAANPITAGFNATGGYISVALTVGVAVFQYTGISTTQFTGVTLLTGSGTLASTGGAIVAPAFSADGLVCIANVFTTGAADTITIALQHSDDGATWATLTPLVNNFAAITAPGGYTIAIPYGTVILRYLRATITTVGATISATLGISAARQ
jgi:hypothetical protein